LFSGSANIPTMEQIPLPPAAKVTREIRSTGYGTAWKPTQGPKFQQKYFAPAPAVEHARDEEEEAHAGQPSAEEEEEEETVTTTLDLDDDTTVLSHSTGMVDEY
jgi:hypothetical protein